MYRRMSQEVTAGTASRLILLGSIGRALPFQGWLLPELSIDSTKLSSQNLPDFALFIGAKMEPSCKNLSLPRFASISIVSAQVISSFVGPQRQGCRD